MKKVLILFMVLSLWAAYGYAGESEKGMMKSSSAEEEEMEEYGYGGWGMGPGMMGYGGYGMGPGMMGYGGYGMGPGMMGYGHMGPGMMGYGGYGRYGGWKSSEDYQKFMDETRELRKTLNMKMFEYNEAARDPKANKAELKKLKKEIKDLNMKIYEKYEE